LIRPVTTRSSRPSSRSGPRRPSFPGRSPARSPRTAGWRTGCWPPPQQ
jgi:hypothetical protein